MGPRSLGLEAGTERVRGALLGHLAFAVLAVAS
jgi:hypothetical protein